jgi:hypothetical protein
MRKIKISSTDLIALFSEQLQTFSECPKQQPIAIVPSKESKSGWTVITNYRVRSHYPACVKRIEEIEKKLSKIYMLKAE